MLPVQFKGQCASLVVRSMYVPRSINDKRYINERIGISLRSTFLHSLRSSSAVKVGGGGKVESPPKSMSSEVALSRFSRCEGVDAFSSDMIGRGRNRLKRPVNL